MRTIEGFGNLIAHGGQAALLAIGFLLIALLARQGRPALAIWAVAAIIGAALFAYLWPTSDPDRIRFKDFLWAYYPAGRDAAFDMAQFESNLRSGIEGFVNLPIVAFVFTPFALFEAHRAALLYWAFGLAAAALACLLLIRHHRLSVRDGAGLAIAFAGFGPLLYSLKEGNTSHVLLAALIGAIMLAARGREIAAGALFGLAAVIKPPLLIVGAVAALRGRWRVVMGGAAVCAGAGLASLAVFGWDLHVLWFEEFRAFSGAPLKGFNNQSLAAAIARAFAGPGSFLDWDIAAPPPAATALVAALSLGVVGFGVWAAAVAPQRAPSDAEAFELEVLMAITAALIVSTVSWSHYHVWLLLPLTYLFAHRQRLGAHPAAVYALVGAYVLAAPSVFLSRPMREGAYEPFSALLVSHLLISAFITFALLALLRAGLLSPPTARAHAHPAAQA